MYLALKESAYEEIFEQPIGKILLKQGLLNLLVFEEQQEEIVQWIQ